MLRVTLAAATLAAGGAAAQGTGSMEVLLSGEDRTFAILSEEDGTDIEGGTGAREVTLVARPDADAEEGPTLTIVFAVEGVGADATPSEPEITLTEADGTTYGVAEGMTATLALNSFTEVGPAFAVSGDFSAELAPEGGGDPLGASGTFQATLESD